MVPYSRNGLHHSHLITVATAHPHVPTLEHTCPSHVGAYHATDAWAYAVNNAHIHLPTNTHGAPLPSATAGKDRDYFLHFFPCCSRQENFKWVLMDANDTDPLYVGKWCDLSENY